MPYEQEEFARKLRGATPFGRHKLFYVLGGVGAVLGFLLLVLGGSPVGFSLGAPGFFLAAWHALQGNRAVNVAEDSFGNQRHNTREYEDLSPEGHAKNARRVAVKLALTGAALIAIDVFLLVNR